MSEHFVEYFQGGVFITPLKSRIGLYKDGEEVVPSIQIGTNTASASKQIAAIAESIQWLRNKVNPLATLTGVGVAIAGKVDTPRQTITQAGRLYGWTGKPLARDMEQAFKAPVALGNDAEARTRWLAEHDRRLAHSSFISLFLGDGVGGSYAELRAHGHHIVNLEPGHMPAPVDDNEKLPCFCGKSGCLDAHSGGARIAHVKSRAGRSWLDDHEWQAFTQPLAAVLEQLMLKHNVRTVVLGGQRFNLNPELKKFLLADLEEATSRMKVHPTVIFTDLEFAPAHTALTLLEQVTVSR